MKTDLDYNDGSGELPEGCFRISASQFSKYMSHPHEWFRQQVLHEQGFTGNTASVLGTVVHYCAEMVGKGLHPKLDHINAYINKHACAMQHYDVDTQIVHASWRTMASTLIRDYVTPNKPLEVEPFVMYEILKGIIPSGSIDAIGGTKDSQIIVDYKTYNGKSKPKRIPPHYRYQLLIYAYICRKMGKPVDRIRLVYVNRHIDGGLSLKTGKPLKSYPPEVTVLTETLTSDDMDYIESLLLLCGETYETYLQDPSMAYLLYRDYRLKL